MSRSQDGLPSLDTAQLSALLRLAAPQVRSRAGLVELLRDPALLQEALAREWPAGLGPGADAVARVTEDSPTLAALIEIKDRAKRAIGDSETIRQLDAGTILYHAAVAAAYGVHGESISSRPLELRAAAYAEMANTLPAGPLQRVFTRALERLEARTAE